MPLRRRHAVLGTLAALAACRSAEPNLYTLLPVTGTQRSGGPRSLSVREVSLARYLDRVQIVRSAAEYRLDVSGNDWWGESLDAMLTRVLVENLAQRLPGTSVVATGGAISSPADAVLEVNVQRLGLVAPAALGLAAQVAIAHRDAPRRDLARTETVTAPVAGTDTAAFVAAASAALGALADSVAASLTVGTAPRSRPAG
jgi:uncharacterized lipoprotein YmbA